MPIFDAVVVAPTWILETLDKRIDLVELPGSRAPALLFWPGPCFSHDSNDGSLKLQQYWWAQFNLGPSCVRRGSSVVICSLMIYRWGDNMEKVSKWEMDIYCCPMQTVSRRSSSALWIDHGRRWRYVFVYLFCFTTWRVSSRFLRRFYFIATHSYPTIYGSRIADGLFNNQNNDQNLWRSLHLILVDHIDARLQHF
jgi:hypothetical protein